MKQLAKNIVILVAIVIGMLWGSVASWGQVSNLRKPGTVLEQLRQSALFQPVDSAVLAATDYMGVFRSACFWKEGLKGSFESRDSIATNNLIEEIIAFATSFEGTRYRRGANGPKAFDCSGFTSYVFAQFGYTLNRTSRQQINNGKIVGKMSYGRATWCFSMVVP